MRYRMYHLSAISDKDLDQSLTGTGMWMFVRHVRKVYVGFSRRGAAFRAHVTLDKAFRLQVGIDLMQRRYGNENPEY
jgi:hypothetical protein